MSAPADSVTPAQGRGGLAWHSLLNLLGQGVPILAALAAMPVLARALGTERIGLLTLAWALIGYLGLFDLGLGRALTQVVSEQRDRSDGAALARLIAAALRLMLVLGVAGGALLALATPWLVTTVLTVSPALEGEARAAFLVIAVSLPVITVTSGLRGVMEAYHRFDLVNAIRAPLGIFHFVGPLLVLPFTRNLGTVLLVLASGRLAAMVAHLVLCLRLLPALRSAGVGARVPLGPLVRTGGWMTVSNVVSPLMVIADRFIIGALLSTAVVAYYTVPYEAVSRLLVLAWSVSFSLFPRFAQLPTGHAALPLLVRGSSLTFAMVFPFALLAVLFAPELLHLWVGPEYAERGAMVLRILALGVFLNALTQPAFTMVQGRGRADISARIHLMELPLYLVAVWMLIARFGIVGAACAWTLRVAVDWLLMYAAARHLSRDAERAGEPLLWAVVLGATAVLAMALGSAGWSVAARTALAAAGALASLGAALALLPEARGWRWSRPALGR